jgi:hypothetical protein
MVLAAILLFALAAAMGLSLAVIGGRHQRSYLSLGIVHAGIAIVALGLLAAQIFHGPMHQLYNNAAVLFLLALVGGVLLLALHEDRKPPPMMVVGIHGVMALAAWVVLLLGYLQH